MKIFPAPNPIMFTLGPFTIYWYGFLITIAIILGFLISLKLAKKYGIKKNSVLDLYFWLIIFGIIGARLYHVACEWQTYLADPLRIIKIWQGGLGIYGAIIAGLIVIWLYSKKNKTLMPHLSRAESRDASPVPSRVEGCLTCPEQSRGMPKFWLTLDILSPALILGLAVGRWGNYFNQELFGPPCSFFWCIPIDLINRPLNEALATHFHPTFLYESIYSFAIFFVLLFLHKIKIKKLMVNAQWPVLSRAEGSMLNGVIFLTLITSYTFFRFFNEFLRIDPQPEFLFLRLGQWVSGGLFVLAVILLISKLKKSKKPNNV